MNSGIEQRLIFALDVDDLATAEAWVERLKGQVGMFKVGKQLFTRCGSEVVHMIRAAGGEVFLDLKYHDIPNTVAKAAVEACRLGVAMLNVHTLGGSEMMRAMVAEVGACCAAEEIAPPQLLGVTILTSSTQDTLTEIGIDRPLEEMVLRLAGLAQQCGLSGVVASPREAAQIRRQCGADFAIVTPGVRPAWAALDDQKRVTTPAEALAAGATHLVIGRPIAAASDPAQAALKIRQEIEAALAAS